MADVILFHHARGLTAGVHDFAERLRLAGHRVTVPDLYDGRIFKSIDAGVAHAESAGLYEIINRGVLAAANMPKLCVYAIRPALGEVYRGCSGHSRSNRHRNLRLARRHETSVICHAFRRCFPARSVFHLLLCQYFDGEGDQKKMRLLEDHLP